MTGNRPCVKVMSIVLYRYEAASLVSGGGDFGDCDGIRGGFWRSDMASGDDG